jgi:6-pyruvoyl-tetrahydropterin synthase
MNRSLLLYFGRLREYLFEAIEMLLCSESPHINNFKQFNTSEDYIYNDTIKKVNEQFIQNLAQKLLFSISNDLPRFNLISPYISALNKDIYKRLKKFLKKKYQKTSLSDFLKQKLKHFVVNLFLTFFFETLTSQEEFTTDTGICN